MKLKLLLTVTAATVLAAPALATAPVNKKAKAKLSGDKEVPGPGDPNGTGKVTVKFRAAKVCWEFERVRRIDTPTAAHIHKGGKKVSGPVVIPLGAEYRRKGCVAVARNVLGPLKENPQLYYVNVHNTDFPDGAIRGQLRVPR